MGLREVGAQARGRTRMVDHTQLENIPDSDNDAIPGRDPEGFLDSEEQSVGSSEGGSDSGSEEARGEEGNSTDTAEHAWMWGRTRYLSQDTLLTTGWTGVDGGCVFF